MSAQPVTSAEFDEKVLQSDVPVLVDFWAVWCGPCKMLAPVIDEISAEAQGFKVYSVNVDEESDLARRYGIMSIPTLLVFKNGDVAERSVGFVPKSQILEMLA